MKNLKWPLAALATVLLNSHVRAQNVSINEDGSSPNPHAILDLKSSTKGFLLPRVNAGFFFTTPAVKGMLVYDSTNNNLSIANGSSWQNIVVGPSGWSLTGNAKLGPADFIGTTDSSVLRFRVNNTPSGAIDVFGNAFFGSMAGQANIPNVTGASATGINNSAYGSGAMTSSSSGSDNVAVGFDALRFSNTGNNNTAVGAFALQNSQAGNNTAVGLSAMISNTTGVNNTAGGVSALNANTTGQGNSAFGVGALQGNATGTLNTAVGFAADVSSSNLTNATAIGSGAIVNASNKVRIGNSSVTAIEGQVPFTMPSDGRFKYQVKEDVKGLDFILQLRPVTYQFDVRRFEEQGGNPNGIREARQTSDIVLASYNEASRIRRSGFIAQEVEQAADAAGYDFSGIIKPKTKEEHYSLSYESFVVPLVKGMQEQQRIIAGLQQQIDELKKLVAAQVSK